VLDVGAGEGHVTRAIRDSRRDPVEAVAVEPTARAGSPLEATVDRWVPRLEDVDEGDFDLALALDVIEHVAEPVEFLAQVAARLRPGGTALISVPNVAHWSMRAALALGRFDYAERGILDRTHLRFFTARSLEQTIRAAGLTLERSDSAVVPLELLVPQALGESGPWRALAAGRLALARACPGLLAYQLLARARKT
jgi:2-polyprenyl-3-methyl-5-hydroxy-6-metoxy-1,4-benzoquinol methylase